MRLLAATILLLLAAAHAYSQAPVVTVAASADRVPFGTSFEVTITMRWPANRSFESLSPERLGLPWTTELSRRQSQEDGWTEEVRVYSCMAFSPDVLSLPALRLCVGGDDGTLDVVLSEPFILPVTTALPSDDDGGFELPGALYEMPVDSSRVLNAVVASLVMLVIIALMLRARRRSETLPPADRALAAIEAVAVEGPGRRLTEELADCVRGYLADRFELPACEMTTEQITHSLEQSGVLAARRLEELRRFLEEADRAKFAAAPRDGQEVQAYREMARTIVSSHDREEAA